jgi:hypothetical protein
LGLELAALEGFAELELLDLAGAGERPSSLAW